jgi:hypothetical protein
MSKTHKMSCPENGSKVEDQEIQYRRPGLAAMEPAR